ncbi:MAG: pyruvate kinase [Clostridia bacterium]|nr:MAG: pyruvate kinase [Clostridia bacterium]
MRHVKIVCTIGPASDQEVTLKEMLQAGMDLARLNFSHGTRAEHGARIATLRQVAEQVGQPLGILLDTQGPELRVGQLPGGSIVLETGSRITLGPEGTAGGPGPYLPINYPALAGDVRPGDQILLDDGLIGLEVEEIRAGEGRITCRVQNNGLLTSRKGINVPGREIGLPALTEKDKEDIAFGLDRGIDFIAASFVRRAADITELKSFLASRGAGVWVIAKIENRAAVENLEEILAVADGVMVARGDLGVEIPAEEVPLVQKRIIRLANNLGKPVITATQMLESMIEHPRPTRAEASDVANAVLDGTDAVMLSGETAAGKYPVEAVGTMVRIVVQAEAALPYRRLLARRSRTTAPTVPDAISYASCTIAQAINAVAIITPTASGSTPRMVAKYRPRQPIIAATPDLSVQHRLTLIWGVIPRLVRPHSGTDAMIAEAMRASLESGLVREGDVTVVTAGVPAGIPGSTNLLKVQVARLEVGGWSLGSPAGTGSRRFHNLRAGFQG